MALGAHRSCILIRHLLIYHPGPNDVKSGLEGGTNAMANHGVTGDLRKARELRALAKSVVDNEAKKKILAASARLENQAARKAARIGHKPRMRKGTTQSGIQLVK